MNQYLKNLDQRFEAFDKAFGIETKKTQKLERELMDLKVALPEKYVLRDDQIRNDTLISKKLDSIWDKIDKIGDKNDK